MHHAIKDHAKCVGRYPHICHVQQNPTFMKERRLYAGSKTNSITHLPVSSTGRCGGSLDRRRRRLRNRADRDQRATSHSDLICHERDKSHHCSLQQLYCGSDICLNNFHNKTEVYCMIELLIKSSIPLHKL